MPNTPNNRPAGRQRTDGGAGQSVSTHGAGLGTGPVGRADGYRGRNSGGAGGAGGPRSSGDGGGSDRAGGIGGLLGGGKGKLIIIVVAVLALLGGGKGLSSLLGGGGNNNQQSSGIGNLLGGLGSFGSVTGGNSSYSSGSWTGSANTGKLNTNVSSAARAKRTVLRGDGTDKVTLMVYLCGTDLESKHGMATSDLSEMAKAKLGSNVNVLVYTGGCKQWKQASISNTVNQIYKVAEGGIIKLEDNMGSAPMTAPQTLTEFINYCKKNYPANRNELILWDHGGGTLSGFGYDEKNAASGSMTLANIARAIKSTGMTFDFIGFDACLMATLETALVLEPYADYLIASEETEPGIGWYYTDWLTKLGANPAVPTTELGKQIVDDFVQKCDEKCRGQKTTLSLIDLAELSATVPKDLAAFAETTAKQISGSNYKTVSKARGNTREFAASNKIDQVDLVHLALNLNTDESKALADTLLSAIKYNRTGGGMTDAYGISAYFPYRKANKVSSAVKQLDDIGFDDAYTDCVKKFASLEVTGQAAGGGSASPFGSLLGSLGGASSGASSGDIAGMIGSLLGGGGSGGLNLSSLLGGAGLFDRSVPESELIAMVEADKIDDSALVWTEESGVKVLKLSEAQWSNVQNIQLNVWLDDGKGYIDLGLDNVFAWTESGDLVGQYENKWLALNKQPVAYYFTDQTTTETGTVINGRVPVLLNGDRAELLITFTDNVGSITGVRRFYANGETETVAKAAEALTEGDVIQPIADRYDYNGNYEDTYRLGGAITYTGDAIEISDVTIDTTDVTPIASYMLTDLFNMEHWTPRCN